MGSKHDECFKGCFSLRVSTCLFIFTLCGRITGALNEPVKVVVMEEDDVILPCSLSTKENIESKLFDWKKDGQKEVFFYDAGLHYNNGRSGQDEQFKGRVSHFPDQLKHGIASIKIQMTKVADSGNYTCIFPLHQPSQTFHIELVVGEKPEKISQGPPTGWIVAAVFIILLNVVFVLVLLSKRFFKKGRRRHENGSGNPPGSDHENGVCLRTEHLLPGSDVSTQTSPV